MANVSKGDLKSVLVWVKFHDVPIMVWDQSIFARAMINLRFDVELKKIIVVAVPKLKIMDISCYLFELSTSGNQLDDQLDVGSVPSDTVSLKGDMADVNVENNKDVNLDSATDMIEDTNEMTSFMAPKLPMLSTTVDQEEEIIYSHLDDVRYDRALLRARVNRLDSDRPFHRRTALLIEEEARLSRAAWARSMDACDQVHSEGISLRTTVMAQQSEITEMQATDHRRQAVITDLLKVDYRMQRQLVETLKIVKSLKAQMIELQRQQGPAKDPAEPELPEEASSST
ncbi:hypothetical protein Tco_0549211 [Tanacetum coccineum]